MSFASLERAMLAEARIVVNNPKLRLKDVMEWSTSETKVKGNQLPDEIVLELPVLAVWVCVDKKHDKRTNK